jgi:adenylosuccinate synthase
LGCVPYIGGVYLPGLSAGEWITDRGNFNNDAVQEEAMSIDIVVGTNWGDEGKGRMVDYFAQNADAVIRFQGGNNAGHTVVNEFGTFALHLIPSGIFNPAVVNVLGPGMVINIEALVTELSELQEAGIDVSNVKVSERATICFPYHQAKDVWEEERLGKNAYGSTKVGIAPAYGDLYEKKGIQVGEIFHRPRLDQRLREIVDFKNLIASGVYGKTDAISYEKTLEWVLEYGEKIRPMVADITSLVSSMCEADKNLLFEAQLGALRDIHFGIYPFTSSSCCLARFACIGGGLVGRIPDRIVGVMKAFSTCVGAGPFVTEMDAEESSKLREAGNEYGAKTGRPRRIGHFDAIASRFGTEMQGATCLALTKLDCLSDYEPLLICTHYEFKGQPIDRFPINALLEECRPVYKEMKGWTGDISGVRKFDDLPANAVEYVLEIERLMGVPMQYISVSPAREGLIDRGAGI